MKIRPEHYETIRAAIEPLLKAHPDALASYRTQGHSEKRFRWDVFLFAKIGGDTSRWICDNLYPYLNDTHIDSALRRITGTR